MANKSVERWLRRHADDLREHPRRNAEWVRAVIVAGRLRYEDVADLAHVSFDSVKNWLKPSAAAYPSDAVIDLLALRLDVPLPPWIERADDPALDWQAPGADYADMAYGKGWYRDLQAS